MANFKDNVIKAVETQIREDERACKFYLDNIERLGYVYSSESDAIKLYTGQNYIYIWYHILTRKPFYIGEGINERWRSLTRSREFFRHIDQGDAAVCKVLDCADEKTARLYEKYITYSFTSNGYDLANKDNNYRLCESITRENLDLLVSAISDKPLTQAVEKTLIKILTHTWDCDNTCILDAIKGFKLLHGETFFSDGGNIKRRKRGA